MKSGRVLVDTNVWVDFFRSDLFPMRDLLHDGRVVCHSCVLGGLLVGKLPERELLREFLVELPRIREAEPTEALAMVEHRRLWGRGLQWNDILLLAAACVGSVPLWTHDRRLAGVAEELGVAWTP